MGKYPINREFFPISLFSAPVGKAETAGIIGSLLLPPPWLRLMKGLSVRRFAVEGYGGGRVPVLLLEPEGLGDGAPALVYFHGGGFFFDAAWYHYRMAADYARRTPCKIIFVRYRLAPRHPFPVPAEDCYRALLWAVSRAGSLGIDRGRIALGGDSAGGNLAAAVAQMARDRGTASLRFQLLIYPATDRRMGSESNRRFTDTPVWNSRLSVKMWEAYLPKPVTESIAYASPAEASSFAGLPPAYIETAEFDCLHDEGADYAQSLRQAGVPVRHYEVYGAPHGFDAVRTAPTTIAAVERRIEYMREGFRRDKEGTG